MMDFIHYPFRGYRKRRISIYFEFITELKKQTNKRFLEEKCKMLNNTQIVLRIKDLRNKFGTQQHFGT